VHVSHHTIAEITSNAVVDVVRERWESDGGGSISRDSRNDPEGKIKTTNSYVAFHAFCQRLPRVDTWAETTSAGLLLFFEL